MKDFNKELKTILENKYLNDEIDISEIAEMLENGTRTEDIEQYISECIDEIEVIYYDNAIRILSDLDPSFKTSIDLALDMGITMERLNSELMATLILQDQCRDELGEVMNLIGELIEE